MPGGHGGGHGGGGVMSHVNGGYAGRLGGSYMGRQGGGYPRTGGYHRPGYEGWGPSYNRSLRPMYGFDYYGYSYIPWYDPSLYYLDNNGVLRRKLTPQYNPWRFW